MLEVCLRYRWGCAPRQAGDESSPAPHGRHSAKPAHPDAPQCCVRAADDHAV